LRKNSKQGLRFRSEKEALRSTVTIHTSKAVPIIEKDGSMILNVQQYAAKPAIEYLKEPESSFLVKGYQLLQ
jgi:hypothetical protein